VAKLVENIESPIYMFLFSLGPLVPPGSDIEEERKQRGSELSTISLPETSGVLNVSLCCCNLIRTVTNMKRIAASGQ